MNKDKDKLCCLVNPSVGCPACKKTYCDICINWWTDETWGCACGAVIDLEGIAVRMADD